MSVCAYIFTIFGSGGTTARHARAAIPITYRCGTLVEMGRHERFWIYRVD